MNELDKSINNEFEQTLIDNGYKFFRDNWKNAIRGIQKRFDDERGTKYFITGYHYNWAKQFPEREDLAKEDTDRYTFHVQFRYDKYRGNNEETEYGKDQTIDVSFSGDFLPNKYRPITSLKEMEDFFEKMFVDFKFDYYELNYVE
jgi:hypothetical protein